MRPAKARGITYEILIKGRRGRRTPKAHHLNSVSNLYLKWKDWFRKLWRCPVTKNLDSFPNGWRPGGALIPSRYSGRSSRGQEAPTRFADIPHG